MYNFFVLYSLCALLAPADSTFPARLTVRPHTMATGTVTKQAGIQIVDTLQKTVVYIPPSAVGSRRVPLVVILGGAGHDSGKMLSEQRAFADHYGVILLLPNAASGKPGWWDAFDMTGDLAAKPHTAFPDVDDIDWGLRAALQQYAIDPDRIAIAGFSNGASYSWFVGRSNMDIFSRVIVMSALTDFDASGPPNPDAQFFLSNGVRELGGSTWDTILVQSTLARSKELRQEGHVVETVLGLRKHVDYQADEAYMWQWLSRSWSLPVAPGGTQRSAAPIVIPTVVAADSDPVLTEDALAKMTTFWTRFTQEPDSILKAARMAHQERLPLMLGEQPISVVKTDMKALAAKYPAIAKDLAAAGLTVEQEESYRAAILRAGFTGIAGPEAGVVQSTSRLAQNLAFLQSHGEAFAALEQTHMWTTQ